jgi:hypothetical protein
MSFFFFPLCLLAKEADYQQTLNKIISYCVVETGRKSMERMEDLAIDGILSTQDCPSDYNDELDDHKAVVLGAKALRVQVGSASGIAYNHIECERQVASHNCDGPLVMVTIETQLLWDCIQNKGLSFRDFCTVCAVNSVIGRRTTPVLVGRRILIARQIGFKTEAVMKSRLAIKKHPWRKPLTESQIRTSLDRLEQRRLITRVVASPRKTYFKVGSVDREQMRQESLVARGGSRSKLLKERERDREFMQAEAAKSPLK